MSLDALHPRRETLSALAVAVMLVTVGCVAPGGPGAGGTDSPTAGPTTGPTTTGPDDTDDSPDGTDDSPDSPDDSPDGTDDSPDDTERSSPESSTVTNPGTPLPDTTEELPDGPKSRPERPETLTEETVSEYAETFEYRYVYNSLWYNQYSNVSVTCEVLSAEEVPVGWKAVVSCTAYSNTAGPKDGTESPTVVHADWFTQVFTYLIDEDSTVRRRATEEETE